MGAYEESTTAPKQVADEGAQTAIAPGFSRYRIGEDGSVASVVCGVSKTLNGSIDKAGYRKFSLVDDAGRRRCMRGGVLVCEAFLGPRPDGMVVLHKDGSKCNDVKDNLMWAPPSDNYLVKNDNSGFQRSYRAANPDIAHVVPEPVTGAEEIFTKSGMRILVDKECFGSLSKYSWSISRGGYARRGFRKDGNKTYLQMHREILGLSPDDNQVVDHINGNKLDNRRANLRICDRSENNWNVPIRSDNTSGLKGVQWHAKSQKWMAQIGFRYRTVYLGLHETAQAAHEAYCLAADMLHGEYANHGTWRES